MKLKKIFLLSLLVLLLIGVSYAAEADNDTTTAETQKVVKDTSTTTDIVDNSINEETKKNKEITKQNIENKTMKMASKSYSVTDFDTLHSALTNSEYSTVTLNIKSNIKLTGDTELNESIKKLTINGNGKTINGDNNYQFLKINSSEVTIKNIKIINCESELGGAIYNYNNGNLTIYNSTFNNNMASWDGGAISGICSIYNSTFTNNNAGYSGGAISYNFGCLTLDNSIFNNNTAYIGGAINNWKGNLTICNSTFKKNFASENYTQDIYNTGRLILIKSHFSSTGKTILNRALIQIHNESKIEEKIYNDGGRTFLLGKLNKNEKNFTYLDQLIHSGQKEIQIKVDIILEEGEEDKFTHGIKIDEDDIIIDGNGHTINAKGDNIFNIIGNNITIKNIKIVNCYSDGYGEAICSNGILTIVNSTFNENTAGYGGAINNYNHGSLTIINSTFNENEAELYGGAIINDDGTLTIYNSRFKNNAAKWGAGAIYNLNGKLTITDSTFNENMGENNGGAIINNFGNLIIYNSIFNKNTEEMGGGTVSNYNGNLTIYNSTFNNNKAKGPYYGEGAVCNYDGTLTIYNSTFNKNTASEGGAVYNGYYGILTIYDSIFNSNTASSGGAVNNYYGSLSVYNSTFNNNTASEGGAILSSRDKTSIINSIFKQNNATNGGAIYSRVNNTKIEKNMFINNTAISGSAIYLNTIPQEIWTSDEYVDVTLIKEGYSKINNNTFKQNKAQETGKAIINKGTKTTIKNNKYDEISKDSSTIYISENEIKDSITNNIFDDGRIITTLTVNKIATTKYDNNITIKGKLLTEKNTLLKGATITVQLNKDKYTVKTDNNGEYTLTVLAKTVGNNNVTVTYAGSSKYSQSTNKTTFIVKQPTMIKHTSMADVTLGTTVKIVGRLVSNVTGQAIKYASVTVKVNNETYKLKTNGAGYVSMNYTVNDYNVQKITFKYNGNSLNLASSNSTTFKVKQPTWIKMANMANVKYGSTVKLVGRLLYNGTNAVKYAAVNVTVNGKTYKVKTDGAGYFRLNYTVNNYDNQKVTFKFAGNSLYLASSNSTTFKVKQPTWIKHASIGKVKQKSTVKIVGRVLYNGTTAVKYVPVNVTVNGKVYKLKTDGAGYYRLNYTATTVGTITFTSNFAGNTLYLASTNSTKFTVVKS